MNPTGDQSTEQTEHESSERGEEKSLYESCNGCLRRIFISTICMILLMVGCAYWRAETLRKYNGLEMGETKEEFIDSWGREPDERFRAATFEVFIYHRRNEDPLRSDYEEHELANAVDAYENLSEMEHTYGAFEFLFNSSGKFVAYGWCGETTHVRTVVGDFEGHILTDIPAEVLEQLETW